MKIFLVVLFAVMTMASHSQSIKSAALDQEPRVMVVGVAHDDSVMVGGISTGRAMAPGKVGVVPIAWLTPSGKWIEIRCRDGRPDECKQFERDYLSKPHRYTVVSADGIGAIVHVNRMGLDNECFGFGGSGTSAGGIVRYAAVAAERAEIFTTGDSARRLTGQDADRVRKALALAVGTKLDSTEELRVYSLNIEGQALVVVQRAFQDYAAKPEYAPDTGKSLDFIFAVGKMINDHFQVLSWKENTEDANEQILGVIHLKDGKDFLVDTISDPETYFFRIYGIRGGKLRLIYEGGGGGC